MRCFEEDTVLRFIRRELPPEAMQEADAHMARCAECRGLVADAARSFFSADGSMATTAAPGGAPPGEMLSPGQGVGRYVITRRLGAGGVGVVYAARDPELRRNVAIKLLREDVASHAGRGQAPLLREARLMAQLSHPNVVSIYDTGTFERQVFLAMELVEGRTLQQWLAETPRPWREVLDAFLEAGKGLAAAHAVGIVHRDFKPANVMIGADGRVRVTDFGLARPFAGERDPFGTDGGAARPGAAQGDARRDAGASHGVATLTATGEIKGTPAYMAPEQFLDPKADARADQFSFAVALYEALFGARPFVGATLEQLVERVLRGEPTPPPKVSPVPAPVGSALLRALSRHPEARFSSMEDLLSALRAGAQAERRARPPRRVLAAAGAGALLVAGVAAFVGARHSAAPAASASEPTVVPSAEATPAAAEAASEAASSETPPSEAPANEAPANEALPNEAADTTASAAEERRPAPARRAPRHAPARAASPSSERPYDDAPLAPSFARGSR